MTKYRAVLIVGPDNPMTDDIRAIYEADDCLIIGDGLNPVTPEEITMQLDGKVAADTRFDIWAHGAIDGTQAHRCHIFNTVDKTSDILSFLGDELDCPIEAHLWSCYGGTAAKQVANLPKGSCFIAHAPKDAPTTILANTLGMTAGVRKHLEYPRSAEHKLDYQHVLDNLGLGAGQNMFVGINKGPDEEPVIAKDRLAVALTQAPNIILPNARTLSDSLDWNYNLVYEAIATADLSDVDSVSLPTSDKKLEHSIEEMENLCTGVMAMALNKLSPLGIVYYSSINPAFHQFHTTAIKQNAPLILSRLLTTPPYFVPPNTAEDLLHYGVNVDSSMEAAFTPRANMNRSFFQYSVLNGYTQPDLNAPAIAIMLNSSPTKENMECMYHHAMGPHVLAYAKAYNPALESKMLDYEKSIITNIAAEPLHKVGPVFIRNIGNPRITEQFLSHSEKIPPEFLGTALHLTAVDAPHFPALMEHVSKIPPDFLNTLVQRGLKDDTKYTTELLKLGDQLSTNSLNILLNHITKPDEQLPLLLKQAQKMHLGRDTPGLLFYTACAANAEHDPSKIINVFLKNCKHIPTDDLKPIIDNSFTDDNKEVLVTALRDHLDKVDDESLGHLMVACMDKPEYFTHITKDIDRIPTESIAIAIGELYDHPQGFDVIASQAYKLDSDDLGAMLYLARNELQANSILQHIDRISDDFIGSEFVTASNNNWGLDVYFAHQERINPRAMHSAIENACQKK